MRTVNHYSKRILALLLVCVLCINLFVGVGSLQRVAAAEIAESGVDLMDSASFAGKAGVLSYDVNKKEGWIGGDGTTASTDQPARYFTYDTFGSVVVDGKTVALTSREVTYSVTFSDFTYDPANTSGVRGNGVALMLQYNDGTQNWVLENRFGDLMYASGHYMQIGGSNSTLLANNAGAPFYSESVKNSVAKFPALANGDTISLKVKCATATEKGYIKLLLNGEEKHTFVYTGTKLPEFGLKSYKLMAKMTNISLTVEGATGWSQCVSHIESEKIVDVQPTSGTVGKWHTECTLCGAIINSGTISTLTGMELIDANASLANPKAGVLTYDVNAKEGWIGGDGTTPSTDQPERYFQYTASKDVVVDGKTVPLTDCVISYSVTFSDFAYDTSNTNGVRGQGVILMLQYNDGIKTWKLENRFGATKYDSGHYMQIGDTNSTLLANNAGAPFYSESVKNSVVYFPALAEGDTISLKVKCAKGNENGYIKLILNGEEKHSFVYTGTELPQFGLKACKLMAKISNVSLYVEGASDWAAGSCSCEEPVIEKQVTAPTCGAPGYTTYTCTVCGTSYTGDEVAPTGHTCVDGICTICGAYEWDTDGDGVLEILAIGNSFSVDALEYVWQIANDLGIEKIVLGNLYIGGCSLQTHATNAAGDLANYSYYYNDSGKWTSAEGRKISTTLENHSWDYVTLQQVSGSSGLAGSYNEDLNYLVDYVKARSYAKLVWHMTWAYQQDSTNASFVNYNSDQMTMYNAIVSATQSKISTNSKFDLIVPNGTAVQNSRTTPLGDTITRDGYHMSTGYGRYLTGLMFFKTVTGMSIDGITYAPAGVDGTAKSYAIESVNNAYAKPFAVTKSTLQHKPGTAVKENETAATCTTPNCYDLVIYCTECGTELSRETVVVSPALGHKYTDGVCTVCGKSEGVDLITSGTFDNKDGVLFYDANRGYGWIGGDGTTASTEAVARYFSYNTFGNVVVDGKIVPLTQCEVTYSVTFSDFAYDTSNTNGVRGQGVILMLQYNDGTKTWTLENRFGSTMYASGHYMQIDSSGSTLLDSNAGSPFYSEKVKNSVANFPDLAEGDTLSLKVKCADATGNGYIKLLINGEEMHTFIYTGTKLPEFGLKSFKLMAKISDISLMVEGASRWSECLDHIESDRIVDTQPSAGSEGSWHTECTLCGKTVNTGTIPALTGFELIDKNANFYVTEGTNASDKLSYNIKTQTGWLGGNGTTPSMATADRYFTFPTYMNVLVDGKEVPFTDCELVYSMIFSEFSYTAEQNCRSNAVCVMLRYTDGSNVYKLENRFGGQIYDSGHYMQVYANNVGVGNVLQDTGAPFYSTVKNSFPNVPALKDGDKVELKIKCANGTENGYIKMYLNGAEIGAFVYTGTTFPEVGLESMKLMAKVSNVSLVVTGASQWAECSCSVPNVKKYEIVTAASCTTEGLKTGKCVDCDNLHKVVLPASHTEGEDWIVEQEADCTNAGSRYKECVICFAHTQEEIIPAAGHRSYWVEDKAATKLIPGSKHAECMVCQEVLSTETIPSEWNPVLVIGGGVILLAGVAVGIFFLVKSRRKK